MTLMLLSYPWLAVLSLICAGVCALAVWRNSRLLTAASALLTAVTVLAALACMLPYSELILLLLPALLVCLVLLGKGRDA